MNKLYLHFNLKYLLKCDIINIINKDFKTIYFGFLLFEFIILIEMQE